MIFWLLASGGKVQMAKKLKSKAITLSVTSTKFTSLFNRLRGEKSDPEFNEVSQLRSMLSNEKARILYTIKNNNPISIYNLSKILKRDFKSVRQDLLILEKFGFIEFEKNANKGRKSLKPVLSISSLHINFEI